MDIYQTGEGSELELLEGVPFNSEHEIEELLFSNKNLMGDLYPFAKQTKSGDGRNIADILAVDDNGMVFVVEIKNVRPRGEDVLMQALRYVDWIKRNPAEIKMIWTEWKNQQTKESILPEPEWNSLKVGILFVAPDFDPIFANMILNSLSIPLRFLTIEKYHVGDKEIIITNQLDQGSIEQGGGIPTSKMTYSWNTYLETTTDEKGLEQAKKLHEETLRVLKEIGLDWLQIKFNKYYVAYKNGGRNVIELYFTGDMYPGLSFHVPIQPSKMNLGLPEGVLSQSYWSEDYKVVYIPVTKIGISAKTLKPLFEEAKKYRT